jgi:hypothetical protein
MLKEMLLNDNHKQNFPAREVREGTVCDDLDDKESTRTFEGVSRIDF